MIKEIGFLHDQFFRFEKEKRFDGLDLFNKIQKTLLDEI